MSANQPTSLDNIKFMNSNVKAEDLDGDIPLKQNEKNKKTEVTIDISSNNNNINSNTLNLVSTLDEPVSVTVTRDLKAVGYKFGHVFFPKRSNLLLKDWDLWGPLCLSVLLAVTLQGDSSLNDGAPQFANIFALIALGAIIVTINTKLLSGKISFFQSICVLGYCLLPLVLISLINSLLILIVGLTSITLFIIRCSLAFVAFAWSVFASTAFLAADTVNLSERKALAIYPIFLFYFIITWLIVLHTN